MVDDKDGRHKTRGKQPTWTLIMVGRVKHSEKILCYRPLPKNEDEVELSL